MSDPIRDALREAVRDMNGRMADRGYEVPWPEDGRLIAAAAVAAFHRHMAAAMPDSFIYNRIVAIAVERAAKEEA